MASGSGSQRALADRTKRESVLVDTVGKQTVLSDRNLTEEFLKKFPADHYIISANGKYGNPDPNTIKGIVQVRGNEEYTMHFTNKVASISRLLTRLSEGKRFEFVFRKGTEPSIVVDLD